MQRTLKTVVIVAALVVGCVVSVCLYHYYILKRYVDQVYVAHDDYHCHVQNEDDIDDTSDDEPTDEQHCLPAEKDETENEDEENGSDD